MVCILPSILFYNSQDQTVPGDSPPETLPCSRSSPSQPNVVLGRVVFTASKHAYVPRLRTNYVWIPLCEHCP